MDEREPSAGADQFAPIEVTEIDLYQKREKIYTRSIEGFYQRIRLFTGWPLLGGYFLLPWIEWRGRQSVLFDLPAREFHILGLTLWPQDLNLLAWLLIIAALALFLVTALAGRVWCGYTCPQTVWTSIFMWAEQKTEGSRNQRIKLDAAPWSVEKVTRKTLKHGAWFFVAFMTGLTFVGYFTPIRELTLDVLTFSAHPWALFWIGFFTLATYLNAGWMREQVCLYMCPYARFQSVMFDRETLIISYDQQRGEPRGSRRRDDNPELMGLGDCIDCELCKQVCPTGIDIREGLQYECIGCALCVDACDSVMDKMGYAPGLISYTTENVLAGKPSRILRPRIVAFSLVLLLLVVAIMLQLVYRASFDVSIVRDRQDLYREVGEATIENDFELRIANKAGDARIFIVKVEGIAGAQIVDAQIGSGSRVSVAGGAVESLQLRVHADRSNLGRGSQALHFLVMPEAEPESARQFETRFFSPVNHHERF